MVPVHDTVFVGMRPYLKPLGDILDTFARYGVALVDKEGAHLFVFHLGTLESATGVAGEDIKRHKQGGWSSSRFQRHEDATAYRNLKEASEMIGEFVREGQVRRLILGGTDANVAHFAGLLSKNAQQAVVGTISADVTASPTEVGEMSLSLIHEISAERKTALVEQLITTAAKGGPAALGLSNTLVAVLAGPPITSLWTTSSPPRPSAATIAATWARRMQPPRHALCVKRPCVCCPMRRIAWYAGLSSRISN